MILADGKGAEPMMKRGYADWADLKGKRICFSWSDGWEDYYVDMIFSHTQPYAEDPRYPRYYILDENLGGYSVWEDETVMVEVRPPELRARPEEEK